MSENDPIQRALERLGELRHAEPSNQLGDEIRGFLRSPSTLVVAKAAKVARELRVGALIPDLLSAFNRFMADAPRLDRRCAAITEVVSLLVDRQAAARIGAIRALAVNGEKLACSC